MTSSREGRDAPGCPRIATGTRPLHPRQPRGRIRTDVARDAIRLSGHEVRVVHVVGGGSANELLCQLTADACGLPIVAGPMEATAIGNVLVQARTHGFVSGDLAALRALVRATHPPRRFEPRPQPAVAPA